MENQNKSGNFTSSVGTQIMNLNNVLQILFNIDERLYLSPMFGNILVSDAKKVVVYCLATGTLINTIHYQKYKKLSREITRGSILMD